MKVDHSSGKTGEMKKEKGIVVRQGESRLSVVPQCVSQDLGLG